MQRPEHTTWWHRDTRSLRAVTALPEWNVAIFALLLNFPWEVLQAPLFAGIAEAPFFEAIKGCSRGTLGDMVIMLIAYEGVSLVARSRAWVLSPSRRHLALFIAIGVSITAVIEGLATRGHWLQNWTYSPNMPVVPGINIGVTPLLQWVVLPLLVIWFVRRQIRGQAGGRNEAA